MFTDLKKELSHQAAPCFYNAHGCVFLQGDTR